MSHEEAVQWALLAMLLLCCLEACAVYHFYVAQRDVFSAGVVLTSWGKEAIRAVWEKFA